MNNESKIKKKKVVLKNFRKLMEKRLHEEEIAQIEAEVDLELLIFKSLQKIIMESVEEYMKKHDLGFNQLVEKLHWSPTQVSKLRQGKSNLTIASIARLFATIEKQPKDFLRLKK